jgi:four helix bundle protein
MIDKSKIPKTGNLILDVTFLFSLEIITYTNQLQQNKNYVLANQLLKSGTSIGANCKEAQNCESKNDFIHKIKIAAKEADETEYWLLLCKYSNLEPCDDLLEQIKSIQKIINKIISTSKQIK